MEGILCGQEEKEDLEFCSFVHFFRYVWNERNHIAFRDENLVL